MKKKHHAKMTAHLIPRKVSEMVIAFAEDYIQLGETLEQKQNYLNAACAAWNIAVLPKTQRTFALENFLREYRVDNPNATATEIESIRHDMELLIRKKLRQFPNVKRAIVKARITEGEEKDRITVTSKNILSVG
ncbi:MAG: hypothetical protein ABIK52_01980 [Bacteroidota bacterium]